MHVKLKKTIIYHINDHINKENTFRAQLEKIVFLRQKFVLFIMYIFRGFSYNFCMLVYTNSYKKMLITPTKLLKL